MVTNSYCEFQEMDLAFASPLHAANGRKPVFDTKPLSSTLHRKLSSQKASPCMAIVATQTSQVFFLILFLQLFISFLSYCCCIIHGFVFKAYDFVLENKKHDLLRAIQDTQRGLVTSTDQRSSIEEALVWFPSISLFASVRAFFGLIVFDW